MRSANRFAITSNWPSGSIRRAQEPKYRTYLTGFQATNDGPPRSRPRTRSRKATAYTVLKQAGEAGELPAAYASPRQGDGDRSHSAGWQIQQISYVGNFNFNWMTNYIYADDAAPVFPKGTIIHVTAWHDNTRPTRTTRIRASGLDTAIGRSMRWRMRGSTSPTSATTTTSSGPPRTSGKFFPVVARRTNSGQRAMEKGRPFGAAFFAPFPPDSPQ